MSIAEAPTGLDPLALRIAEAAHRLIVDLDLPSADLPYAIAVRVLADGEIREALRAREIVARLDEAHSWRSWGPESTARSCSCGTAGCGVRDVLDGEG